MNDERIAAEARAAQDALEAAMMGTRRSTRVTSPLPRVEVAAVPVGVAPVALPRSPRPIVAVRVDEPVREKVAAVPSPVLPSPRLPLPLSPAVPAVLPAVETVETWEEEGEENAIEVEEYTPAAASPEEGEGETEGEGKTEASPTPTRRKRKTHRGGPTIQGTDRDRRVINSLTLLGMSTTALMVDLVNDGSSVKAIEKRLYKLQAAGLVKRIAGVWNCPSVWVPTRRGVGLSQYPDAPVRSASDMPWTVATHELKIAEVVARLRTGALARHIEIPRGVAIMTGRLIEAAYNRRGALIHDADAGIDAYMEAPESLALLAIDPGKGYRAKYPDLVILRPGMAPLYVEVERSKKRDYEYEDLMTNFYAPTGADVLYLVDTPAIGTAVRKAATKAGIVDPDTTPGAPIGLTTMTVRTMDLAWCV